MSIFDKIKDSIFGTAEAAEPAPAPAAPAPTPPAPPPAGPATAPAPVPASPAPAPTVQPGIAPTAATPAPAVDVAAIMDKAVKDSGQTLQWRKSIVDMMKALGLDSSLSERKELAAELGYTGDADDSAAMNLWLHKALMKKLSENGGKVPSELTD